MKPSFLFLCVLVVGISASSDDRFEDEDGKRFAIERDEAHDLREDTVDNEEKENIIQKEDVIFGNIPQSLVKGRKVAYREFLPRGWRLSVDIKPHATKKGYTNIIHATLGGDNGKYGERTPLINFAKESTGLHICSAINGDSNTCFNTEELPIYKFTTVVVQQTQKGETEHYLFQILINGKIAHQRLNTQPESFGDVWYFASDQYRDPAEATIKNLKLTNFEHKGIERLEKKKIIERKNLLPRGWTVSFEIKPTSIDKKSTNILHATNGGKREAHGEKTPQISFKKGTTILEICSTVNNNAKHCKESPEPLPLNKYTPVIVQQVQSITDNKYYFQIIINGKIIANDPNDNARTLENVSYFASSDWERPAHAVLRNFQLKTYEHQGPDDLVKGKIIAEMAILPRGWYMVFQVKPFGTQDKWANIIQGTDAGSQGHHGERTPYIALVEKTTQLRVCASFNGDPNFCYDHDKPLDISKFSTITVEQRQLLDPKSDQYLMYFLKIRIHGDEIFSQVNNDPRIFYNVKYYASCPWKEVAKAYIQHFRVLTFKHMDS